MDGPSLHARVSKPPSSGAPSGSSFPSSALAGGLEITLGCDVRLASERAIFGSFEELRGFHHGHGGITRLVNTWVGVAMQIVLTAEPIDGNRALHCNMTAEVVPQEQLREVAEILAGHILRNSQRAVQLARGAILDVIGKPLDDQLRTGGGIRTPNEIGPLPGSGAQGRPRRNLPSVAGQVAPGNDVVAGPATHNGILDRHRILTLGVLSCASTTTQ